MRVWQSIRDVPAKCRMITRFSIHVARCCWKTLVHYLADDDDQRSDKPLEHVPAQQKDGWDLIELSQLNPLPRPWMIILLYHRWKTCVKHLQVAWQLQSTAQRSLQHAGLGGPLLNIIVNNVHLLCWGKDRLLNQKKKRGMACVEKLMHACCLCHHRFLSVGTLREGRSDRNTLMFPGDSWAPSLSLMCSLEVGTDKEEHEKCSKSDGSYCYNVQYSIGLKNKLRALLRDTQAKKLLNA